MKKGRKPLISLFSFFPSVLLFYAKKSKKKKYTHPKFFVFQKKKETTKSARGHVGFATLNKNKKLFTLSKLTHTHKKMSQSMQATGRVRFYRAPFFFFKFASSFY